MAKWNAYYFDALDATLPARVTTIQADNEDEAGKVAIAQMGRCMRVHVTRSIWEAPGSPHQSPREPLPRAAADGVG
jgi:hypothetical protein